MHLPSAGCQANLVKVSLSLSLSLLLPLPLLLFTLSSLQSLQSLGLTHVLNMYLTGVGAASPQSMQGLSRFQYEAAWRCAVWEDQNSRSTHHHCFSAIWKYETHFEIVAVYFQVLYHTILPIALSARWPCLAATLATTVISVTLCWLSETGKRLCLPPHSHLQGESNTERLVEIVDTSIHSAYHMTVT